MRKAAVYFQLKVVMEDKQAIESSGPAIFAMVYLYLLYILYMSAELLY